MSASSNFKYDGTDLYVMNMTQTGTSYIVFYNNITGRFSYNLSTAGTVSSITAGDGLSGGTINTIGTISLGTPFDITEMTSGTIFSDGHDHKIKILNGITGSILYKSILSGLTTSSNLIFDGNNLYIPNMESSINTYCIYYDNTNGKLTYNTYTEGTVTNISAGSGMSFSDITNTGVINLGVPSTVNSYSDNTVNGSTHSHKFTPYGDNGEIQFNSGGTLFSSTGLTYDGFDLYVSGMTSNVTNNVIYYNDITGQFTYGIKPSGGGATLPTGSTSFNTETKIIDSYLNTNYRFAVYNYVIYSGETNSRAGTITLVNNQLTESRITESSTTDIGDTSSVLFNVINDGTNVNLSITSTTDGWICEWIRITK